MLPYYERAKPEEVKTSVYRYGDKVALSTPGQGTIYLDMTRGDKLSDAIQAVVNDINRYEFSKSKIPTKEI